MCTMDSITLYNTVKALHIISFVSWMAGMFYLPRLYVYHTGATKGGEADLMLQVMERKLLRFIINPAMIATWGFGLWLAVITQAFTSGGWFHAKMAAVMLMSGVHMLLAVHRGAFARGDNTKSERYFRLLNEAPTLLLIVIVWLVVFKPF
jgi:protoporphyrinogen IX oxidase